MDYRQKVTDELFLEDEPARMDEEAAFQPFTRSIPPQVHVQRQSQYYCDVTIRVGPWVKMFHRTVLQRSPFFAKMFLHDWCERQTGYVHIRRGTKETVDATLSFLYGQTPNITEENAVSLLDLAEFFLIPDLKEEVINWFKVFEITDDVACELLKISTLYNFHLPELDQYIESHLDTLVRHPGMLIIADDTLRYFLSNRKFSYVSMADKLRFLVRWTETHGNSVLQTAKKLLKHIDFSDICEPDLDQLPSDVIQWLNIDTLFAQRRADTQKRECLLVLTKSLNGRGYTILCFDTVNKRWCRVNTHACKQFLESMSYLDSCSADEALSVLHLHSADRLYSINIETDKIYVYKLVSETQAFNPDGVLRSEDRVFAYRNSSWFLQEHTVVYTGEVDSSQEHIEFNTLFPLENQRIVSMCFNKCGTLALLTDEHLILYDTTLQCITEISERFDPYEYHMCPFRDGFAVFNLYSEEFKFVLKGEIHGHAFDNQDEGYQDREISYSCTYGGGILLRFESSSCHRFPCGMFRRCSCCISKTKFASASSEDVIKARHPSDISWNKIVLPQSQSIRKHIADSYIFSMLLPSDKIRCHFDCPHCKPPKRKRSPKLRKTNVKSKKAKFYK